jgi:hypothetical protein
VSETDDGPGTAASFGPVKISRTKVLSIFNRSALHAAKTRIAGSEIIHRQLHFHRSEFLQFLVRHHVHDLPRHSSPRYLAQTRECNALRIVSLKRGWRNWRAEMFTATRIGGKSLRLVLRAAVRTTHSPMGDEAVPRSVE